MAPAEAMFTGVAVELDEGNQIFTTLPVVPVQREMIYQESIRGVPGVQGLSRSREDGVIRRDRGGRRSGTGRPSGGGVRLWAAGLGKCDRKRKRRGCPR